jgi:predicted GIY-YIG superfamily endonuclease
MEYYLIVFYVYFLENKDKIPYVGCTNDLKDRFQRHNKGYVPATKALRPWILVAYFAFNDEKVAFRFEKYMKTGSGREFIKRHIKWNDKV